MITRNTLLSRASEINSLMNVNVIYTTRSLRKLLIDKNIHYDDSMYCNILLVARENGIIRFDKQLKNIRYWKKEI